MTDAIVCFAACPKGAETLLVGELRSFGATEVRRVRAGASFAGDLAVAYRVCLWSRVASRVLMQLAAFPISGPDDLYAGVSRIPWEDHVAPDGTLAVDFVTTAPGIHDTRFGAVRVKDAVVDRMREKYGVRPDVDVHAPDVRINVSVRNGVATVALDLSGESLHRRAWREPGVGTVAPLKESLAAAMLLASGWPQLARDGWGLAAPMCGSGTLPIEAALIAADRAPGLLRERWGFTRWLGHDEAVWARLAEEARRRAEDGKRHVPALSGSDSDERAVAMALGNAARAGVADIVTFEVADMAEAAAGEASGLVVVNPPYGARLASSDADLRELYHTLGTTLRHGYAGWIASVLVADVGLGLELGLVSPRERTLFNGAIECTLLTAELPAPEARGPRCVAERLAVAGEPVGDTVFADPTSGAAAFANRLRKNARRLGKWARRGGIECYRVYDADLPEYAVAIDLYGPRAVIAEYEAPAEIDPVLAQRRLAEVVALVPEVLSIDSSNTHVKVRRRQRGSSQYERLGERGRFLEVAEGGLTFLVNLTDYLDTGLFLDHRPTRAMLRELAPGTRFANLFCYTGSATVYAVAGGAVATTSVDLSPTYLEWARRNFTANGIEGPSHELVRADVTGWLAGASPASLDLVFCDPPTFSNSARLEGTFEIARDHVELLQQVHRVLGVGGVAVFSTNSRRFKLEEDAVAGLFDVEDVSAATIPEDFARSPRIHRCWVMRKK